MHRKLWISIGLTIAAIALIGGCSCSFSIGGDSLDRAEVEDGIAEGLAEEDGPDVESVSCPEAEEVDVEAGETFDCSASAANDLLATIGVRLTDDEGGFTWRVAGQLNLSTAERRIQRQLEEQVGEPLEQVDCPPASEVELAEGEQFECTGIVPGGEEFTIDVTLSDDQGGFELDVPEDQFEDGSPGA